MSSDGGGMFVTLAITTISLLFICCANVKFSAEQNGQWLAGTNDVKLVRNNNAPTRAAVICAAEFRLNIVDCFV